MLMSFSLSGSLSPQSISHVKLDVLLSEDNEFAVDSLRDGLVGVLPEHWLFKFPCLGSPRSRTGAKVWVNIVVSVLLVLRPKRYMMQHGDIFTAAPLHDEDMIVSHAWCLYSSDRWVLYLGIQICLYVFSVVLVCVGGHCWILQGWRGHSHLFWHSLFVFLFVVVWHLVLLWLCLPAAFPLSLMCHVVFNQKILLSLKNFFLDIVTRQKNKKNKGQSVLHGWKLKFDLTYQVIDKNSVLLLQIVRPEEGGSLVTVLEILFYIIEKADQFLFRILFFTQF